MNKYFGIALVFIALAVAIVPIFTDCQSQGHSMLLASGKEVPMKCHWTGIAELGVAIPLLGIGVLMSVGRRKTSLKQMGALGIIIGALAISFPVGLIGVCPTPTMLCNTTMQPALVALGSLAAFTSFGVILWDWKARI